MTSDQGLVEGKHRRWADISHLRFTNLAVRCSHINMQQGQWPREKKGLLSVMKKMGTSVEKMRFSYKKKVER